MAELGGAVLLTVLGRKAEDDWGRAYRYMRSNANGQDNEELLREVMRLTNRVADAVRLILDEASSRQGSACRRLAPEEACAIRA